MKDSIGVCVEPSVKILHILDHSLPYVTGYSLKTYRLIKLQRDLGLTPLVITSPRHEIVSNSLELIDGIYHYRTFPPMRRGDDFKRHCLPQEEKLSISILQQAISELVSRQRIHLIHAHLPCTSGLAALEVCRREKIPMLYDMSNNVWQLNNRQYSLGQAFEDSSGSAAKEEMISPSLVLRQDLLEAFLWRQAEAVVVREESWRQELIELGVPEGNVFVVSGEESDCHKIPSAQSDSTFSQEGHLQEDDQIVRFIRSLYHRQGASSLLQVCGKISGENEEDGPEARRHQCFNTSGHIIYIGQVGPRNFHRRQPIVEILVYPWVGAGSSREAFSLDPIEALMIDHQEDRSGGKANGNLYEHELEESRGSLGLDNISDLTGKCLKFIINRQIRHLCRERTCQQSKPPLSLLKRMERYFKIYTRLLSA
ncbi:MAG: hypothetical protein K6U11_00835 [bacterium]|nr:hypothetical protein [bacterium]